MNTFSKVTRYLVTGGTGSIGSALVRRLLEEGSTVCSFDNSEDRLFNQSKTLTHLYPNLYKPFLGDVRDINRLRLAFQDVSRVFHCAALKHVGVCEYNPFEALKTNVIGTQNVIDACFAEGVERLVFASSDKAVNPTSTMGTTKLLAERLILSSSSYSGSSKFKASCVRFGNVWNTNGSVAPIFLDQARRGLPLTVTSPDMTRYFIELSDALDLCFYAMRTMDSSEIFVADMGSLNIYELALAVNDVLQSKAGIKVVGSVPGEKLYEELLTENELSRTFSVDNYYIIWPAISSLNSFELSNVNNPDRVLRSDVPTRRLDPYALIRSIV